MKFSIMVVTPRTLTAIQPTIGTTLSQGGAVGEQ
jgi:hypothetical protein